MSCKYYIQKKIVVIPKHSDSNMGTSQHNNAHNNYQEVAFVFAFTDLDSLAIAAGLLFNKVKINVRQNCRNEAFWLKINSKTFLTIEFLNFKGEKSHTCHQCFYPCPKIFHLKYYCFNFCISCPFDFFYTIRFVFDWPLSTNQILPTVFRLFFFLVSPQVIFSFSASFWNMCIIIIFIYTAK